MEFLTTQLLRERLEHLESTINVVFESKELLLAACMHKSYLNEHDEEKLDCNERLEFLGDAVLELASTEFLYKKYPDHEEGELTAFRSALVKGNQLALVATELKLGDYLLLSHGEEKSGGREKGYLLANLVEAIIGAIYMDQGFVKAHEFITEHILKHLQTIVDLGLHIDAKSKLQEMMQDKRSVTPTYEVVGETGPDHHKVFEVAVTAGEELLGKGTGSSKQKAEQSAAENALSKINQ